MFYSLALQLRIPTKSRAVTIEIFEGIKIKTLLQNFFFIYGCSSRTPIPYPVPLSTAMFGQLELHTCSTPPSKFALGQGASVCPPGYARGPLFELDVLLAKMLRLCFTGSGAMAFQACFEEQRRERSRAVKGASHD